MTISTLHLFILFGLKQKPKPYDSISEKSLVEYEYLIEKGYAEYSGEVRMYDEPNAVGCYINPDAIHITQEGIAVFDTFIREQLLVWLGILIDFILALIALIV